MNPISLFAIRGLVVSCICLAVISCREPIHIDQDTSVLLDSAAVIFEGERGRIDFAKKILPVGNGEFIVLGLSQLREKEKRNSTKAVFLKYNMRGEQLWKKEISRDNQYFYPRDAIMTGDDQFLALVDHYYTENGEKVRQPRLVTMNTSGEIITNYTVDAMIPEGNQYLESSQLVRLNENRFTILTHNRKPGGTVRRTGLAIYWMDNHTPHSFNDELGTGIIHSIGEDRFIGYSSHYRNYPTSKIVCFTTDRNRETVIRSGDSWIREIDAQIEGIATDVSGNIMISAFNREDKHPVIAKVNSSGDLLWVKQFKEMNQFTSRNLINWGEDQFLIAATKTHKSRAEMRIWDSMAAFIVDGNGTIVDADICNEHWTIATGVTKIGNKSCVMVGSGSPNKDEYGEEIDISLHCLSQ